MQRRRISAAAVIFVTSLSSACASSSSNDCVDRVCGTQNGESCGACLGPTDWCNPAGQCVDDCLGLQCGTSPHLLVACGICPGATDWCSGNTCVDDCLGRECGLSPNAGLSCGTCTGTTDWCTVAGQCVDDCAGRECGLSPNAGASCGACSGDDDWCTSAGQCADDCEGRECGLSPHVGADCGTCPGTTDWCTAQGTCIDDCASRICGTSPNGLDCGTCAECTATTDSARSTFEPTALVIAPLDAGAVNDIVVVNYKTEGTASVFLGDGAGGFVSPPTTFELRPPHPYQGLWFHPLAVLAAHFDGDANIDLAFESEEGALSVFLGAGDGTFTYHWYGSSGNLGALAAGDLNDDGIVDLISPAVSGIYGVNIYFGVGDGTFTERYPFLMLASDLDPKPSYAYSTIADIDEDGWPDLVIAESHTYFDQVRVVSGGNDLVSGDIPDTWEYEVGDKIRGMAAGDLDNDGHVDLALSNRTMFDTPAPGYLQVMYGTSTTSFHGETYVAGIGSRAISVVDLNADGALDLVTTNSIEDTVYTYFNRGARAFSEPSSHAAGTTPWAIAVGHLDGDGDVDLVVANRDSDDITVIRGDCD